MGLVGLEKLAWLEAADSRDSRRVESYGSSPGSNGILGRIHENILNNYPKYIHDNLSKIYCTGLPQARVKWDTSSISRWDVEKVKIQ